jgi:hypothetical protein
MYSFIRRNSARYLQKQVSRFLNLKKILYALQVYFLKMFHIFILIMFLVFILFHNSILSICQFLIHVLNISFMLSFFLFTVFFYSFFLCFIELTLPVLYLPVLRDYFDSLGYLTIYHQTILPPLFIKFLENSEPATLLALTLFEKVIYCMVKSM